MRWVSALRTHLVMLARSQVMPDNRTVYVTDDGTNVGFFKLVTDKAGDLSSGEHA